MKKETFMKYDIPIAIILKRGRERMGDEKDGMNIYNWFLYYVFYILFLILLYFI